ncbi:MAG: multicopper oxidase family protein [Candidatus Gracilibacteria bacterium]|nr:multicopper oxidase family protein [Candidatus Gracilibacteria bacterium]
MPKFFLFIFCSIFLVNCGANNTITPPLTNTGTAESPQETMMREHCKMMPEMNGCEKYLTETTTNTSESLNTQILTDDATTTDAKPTEVVNLKNGDTYNLTIQKVRKVVNGKSIILLSYNGSIPGPTFRVPRGAEVIFRVKNTVAGLETTIHPHGLRLDNQYDGVPKSLGGFQDPIAIGNTYEQKIKFPDTGIFWFHPHTRDDFEQEAGEYGTFLVYDPAEKPTYDTESVIVLDDILLNSDGTLANFASRGVDYTLMGRYGNTMLINGETNFSLTMKQNEVKRLYLVNTANARPFDFTIPGVKMKLVGGDNGYYEQETWVDHIIISPAERYIIDIMPTKSGSYPISSIGGGKNISLGTLSVTENSQISGYKKDFETLNSHDILGGLGSIESYFTKAPDKSLTIGMTMKGMENMGNMHMGNGMIDDDSIEWEDTMNMMNINSSDKNLTWELTDDTTGKKNMDIDWTFQKGSLVKIHIYNDPNSMHPMQHPFHMHGQRFLVLNQNGTQNDNLVWKDTVLIPKGESVDILVDMSNPGVWMAHCHIVEHLFAGMMFGYTVEQ